MTTIELQTLLDRVKEEIRIFERPSADNSKKMFELLTEAVKNNAVSPLVSQQRELLAAFSWVSSIGEQFFDSSKTVEDMVDAYLKSRQ